MAPPSVGGASTNRRRPILFKLCLLWLHLFRVLRSPSRDYIENLTPVTLKEVKSIRYRGITMTYTPQRHQAEVLSCSMR